MVISITTAVRAQERDGQQGRNMLMVSDSPENDSSVKLIGVSTQDFKQVPWLKLAIFSLFSDV
jgi:hypothetical protein